MSLTRWAYLLCAVLAQPAIAAQDGGAQAGQTAAVAAADLDALDHAIAAGRLIQARLMIGSLTPREANNPRFNLLLGRYHLAQREYVLALDKFGKALASGNQPDAAIGAGIASLRLGNMADAKKHFTSAISAGSRDWRPLNGLGVIADAARDWPAAEAAYKAALQIAPQEPDILNNHGYSLLLQRRFQEAADVLGHAARARPDDPVIDTNHRLALALSGQYDEAIGTASEGSALARRLNNAGYAAWLKRDLPAARALLARAREAQTSYYALAEHNLTLVEGSEPR